MEDFPKVATANETVGPTRHPGVLELRLAHLAANVIINSKRADADACPIETELILSGPKDALEDVSVGRQGLCLLVKRKGTRRFDIDDTPSPDTEPANIPLTASLNVPRGAGVLLNDVRGDIEVRDTCGPLVVRTRGGRIRIGAVRDATIIAEGDVNIRVFQVCGPLSVHFTGSGSIKVERGDVTSLHVVSTGSGSFRFDGTAKTALLVAMGSGDITVANKVETRPIVHKMGFGDVYVG